MPNENERTAPPGTEEEANFIAAVKRIREERGWSQGELARRMADDGWPGFHQTTISRIEKGERPVRLGEARGLAKVLGALVGQMILPNDQSQALRDLELSVQQLSAAGGNIHNAVMEFQGAHAVVRYELAKLQNMDLEPTMDAGVAERLEVVLGRARRLVKEGVNPYIASGLGVED